MSNYLDALVERRERLSSEVHAVEAIVATKRGELHEAEQALNAARERVQDVDADIAHETAKGAGE